MLDHVFLAAIGSLRAAFEAALLERHAMEERFQVDVLLGDVTWETSYGLPGEGLPPRAQADVTLDWPTWSQTAYRSLSIGEDVDDELEILVELVFRLQRLRHPPDPGIVLAVLPPLSPPVGADPLERSGPTVEQIYDDDLEPLGAAIEVSYEGVYQVDAEVLEDTSVLDLHFGAIGGWIAATLVRLGDLKLEFLAPDDREG